jgi:hypothetical protein
MQNADRSACTVPETAGLASVQVSTNDHFQKRRQKVATFRFRPKQEALALDQSVTVSVVAIYTPDEIDRVPEPLLA